MTSELKFREGNNFIIPYLEIPLVKDKKELIIIVDEAIVGPTPHEMLSIEACKNLLLTQNVSSSEIPYRNW